MGKTKKGRIARAIKKHAVSGGAVLGALLLSASFLIWHSQWASAQVRQNEAATAQLTTAVDKQIAQIKEQKAAEEKAKQEAAAQQIAEQAKSGSVSDAAAIDSKLCNSSKTHNNPASIDVVVNKKHCIQPLNFAPSNLVSSNGATLSAQAIDAYKKMFAAAATAGQPFYTTSSYRSYAHQISTYNRWVSISGRDGADTYSARPGYSEHQTGLAFDVAANGCTLDCFGKTTQYVWFQQNAADYGFIQRYYKGYEAITGYKAEEWHYRYVGVEVAKDMKAKGIKTLEQYWNISGGDY